MERKSVEDYLALKYAPYVATAGAPEITPNGGAFQSSVLVSIVTGTPGATLRYTVDGSEPEDSSSIYTDPLVLTASAVVRARAFHPAMNPSPVSAAAFVRSGEGSPAGIPGMRLWVSSEAGVITDGASRVTEWLDLSGQGNHLRPSTAAGQPLLVPNEAGGLGVVHFDGSDDTLLFTSRLTTVRTVFWVVREEASAPNGYRHLLGDASSYDFQSGSAHQIWSGSANAALRSGETRVNGSAVDGTITNRPTALSIVSLVATGPLAADAFSRDRTYGRSWWGDLAELVVYDRPLTSSERKAVEDYLALKFGLYVPTAASPVFAPNGSTSVTPVRVTLTAEPGADIRYTLDESDPTETSALYAEPLVFTARTTAKARAFRPGFNPSPVSTAKFLDGDTPAPLRAAGLKLWVRADAGVIASAGSVSAWADQSGNGNHLVQTTAASQPRLVEGAANGLPVVRFDGQGDAMLFTTRLTKIRTVFWVVRADGSSNTDYRFLLGDSSLYDLCSGTPSAIWSSTYTSASVRNGETRLNGALVNGTTTARPTTLSAISLVTTGDVTADAFSRDRTVGRSWWGDLAELLVYDRPLSDSERETIEGYLAAKYALWVPTVVAPTISPAGGRISGTVTVQLDTPTAGATIHYTLDDAEPTDTSPAYAGPLEIATTTRMRAKAFLAGFNPSRETVATFFGEDEFTPASLPNLALWVRADAGLGSDRAACWADQGGAGNALLQPIFTMRPTPAVDEASRMPLLRFDGIDDTLFFTQRLAAIRTVFWVIRRSPSMTWGYRMLLGDSSVCDFCSDGTTKLWSASYTSAAVRNGVTRLNGVPVDGVTADRPADLSVISLVTTDGVAADAFSRDRNLGRSWWGDLAELVIYDRALSAAEITSVEAYLAGRYGIGVVP